MLLDPPARRLERMPVVPLLGLMTFHYFVRSADGTAVTRPRVPVIAADSRGHHTSCPGYATALGR
ncbi:hypothetical protein [Streptomyces canus]|uniref:hypothetical protein n=1 Tax=Streptomyces canus TaxID=58343 RepID=UPI0027D7CAE2|nr:hypothetical protein [Streptomyces canus]